MTAYDPDRIIVGHGPEQIEDVVVHQDGVIEAVTLTPLRAFDKGPDGALVELFGEAKAAALEAFWGGVEDSDEYEEDETVPAPDEADRMVQISSAVPHVVFGIHDDPEAAAEGRSMLDHLTDDQAARLDRIVEYAVKALTAQYPDGWAPLSGVQASLMDAIRAEEPEADEW